MLVVILEYIFEKKKWLGNYLDIFLNNVCCSLKKELGVYVPKSKSRYAFWIIPVQSEI